MLDHVLHDHLDQNSLSIRIDI